jgi:hypothetical protein
MGDTEDHEEDIKDCIAVNISREKILVFVFLRGERMIISGTVCSYRPTPSICC